MLVRARVGPRPVYSATSCLTELEMAEAREPPSCRRSSFCVSGAMTGPFLASLWGIRPALR